MGFEPVTSGRYEPREDMNSTQHSLQLFLFNLSFSLKFGRRRVKGRKEKAGNEPEHSSH